MSRLEALKQKLSEQRRPFPVWALLILYQNSHRRDTYCNHYEGLKELINWLSPIELTPHSEPIPPLYRTYDIQEISKLLGTTQENLNHGYQTALSILQLSTNFTFMPKEISTISPECNRENT